MLTNWLPFLFYAVFAAAIPASMLLLSFRLPQRPRERPPDEVGRRPGPRQHHRDPIHTGILPLAGLTTAKSTAAESPG